MKAELTLRIAKGRGKEFAAGFPWLFKGDYVESSEQALCPAGCIADVTDARGTFLARGTFNAAAPIPFREWTRRREPVEALIAPRLKTAVQKREKIYPQPYYRLVHSEGDFLPGLVIDRFGDILVAQISTAGMEALWPQVMHALEQQLPLSAIVLRNDIAARGREGLAQEVRIAKGEVPGQVELIENDCRYLADLIRGQKTGWFYDQRNNRAYIASLAQGKTLLDLYSHSGGFGLLAAKAGAQVTMVDSSALALSIARNAASLNGVQVKSVEADAVKYCDNTAQEPAFDLVCADPPAFVKSPKDVAAGLKAYGKVARAAVARVTPGGIFYMASCSHRATRAMFEKAVMQGVAQAGRRGAIIQRMGAGADHPLHPKLRQNEYLKSVTLRID